jgi:hypothetical protein
MKKNGPASVFSMALLLLAAEMVYPQESSQLRIDPLLLVSFKECRNITRRLRGQLFPGWNFYDTPALFYRPNIQELLINYPGKPDGFTEYKGFSPFKDETIYVRNDMTTYSIDDQNTSTEIDGIRVLVVADPFSRMRNQIRGAVLNHTDDFVVNWLDQWNFLPSPYQEIRLILHEAFHIYQKTMAPHKKANEMAVTKYPFLDPVNNSLYVLEGNTLRDAILSKGSKERTEKIKKFAAVRTVRQSRLDKELVEYENLNEYVEGTAKYVEYKFLRVGETVEPIDEMYYRNGFNGYRGILSSQFEDEINDMLNIVSVSDDRLGNRYGAGPMRFRLYALGACQALLLDEVSPEWKGKIFEQGVYLCDLLKRVVNLSKTDQEEYLRRAKAEYDYEDVYHAKLAFEREGKKRIQEKIDRILKTDNTLVTISYQGYTEDVGLAFTPFGVTQIDQHSAIYDMVPITVIFREGVLLQFKKIIPVIIDKGKQKITFATESAVTTVESNSAEMLDTNEFTFTGAEIKIEKEGNKILIWFK